MDPVAGVRIPDPQLTGCSVGCVGWSPKPARRGSNPWCPVEVLQLAADILSMRTEFTTARQVEEVKRRYETWQRHQFELEARNPSHRRASEDAVVRFIAKAVGLEETTVLDILTTS